MPSAASPTSRRVFPTEDVRLPDVARVEVELAGGRIEIGTRKRADVRVRTTVAVTGWRARVRWLRSPRVPVLVRDGVLHVRGRAGQVRVQIDVPSGLPVAARVDTGDLTLWGADGDLDLTVGTGILAGRELAASSVRARAGDGEINLHFRAVPAAVDARCGRGSVLLVVPAGRYRLSTEAGSSTDVEVTVDDDPAALPQLVAATSSGRVAVLAAQESQPI